ISTQANSKFLNVERIKDILGLDSNTEFEKVSEYGEDNFINKSPIHRGKFNDKELYRSVLAYDSFIKPLVSNDIEDKILFDFMFLYTLSIWVRYRPDL